jgi:hypothetical protein
MENNNKLKKLYPVLVLEQGSFMKRFDTSNSKPSKSGPIKFDALTQKSLGPELVAHIQKYPNDYKIAKKIYDSKGYVWDNEYAAVKALLSIKNTKQYDSVQKIFSSLSGGRNIIQYVTSFIQVRDSVNTLWAPTTIKYIQSLIKHLTKIGISAQSIKSLSTKLAYVKKWYAVNVSQAEQPGQMEFAWDTWMKRSLKDPEFKHSYFEMLAIATSFIPGIGLMISSGIMLADAEAYWVEGDRLSAGYSAVFALIPGVFKGISKVPGIQRLGAEGMAILAEKLATSKYRLLNELEIAAVKDLVKYKDVIKRDLNTYFKARAKNELVKTLKSAASPGVKGFVTRLANGSMAASTIGKTARVAAPIGAFMGAQHVGNKTWDNLYVKMGYDINDIEDQNKKTLQALLKPKSNINKENVNAMDNEKLLEQIIRNTLMEQSGFQPIVDKPEKSITPSKSNFEKNERVTVGATYLFQKTGDIYKQVGKYDPAKTGDAFARYLATSADGKYIQINFPENKPKPVTTWVDAKVVKKYNAIAKNKLGLKSWIAILILGSVASYYLKGKIGKYLISKGWVKGSNVFANIIRVTGGGMGDLFKYFKGANVEKLREGIRKMHAEGAINSQERDELLTLLENPQVYRDIQTKFFDDAVKAYVKGGPNAPTANEILGLMTPKLRQKYGAQIKAMETARKAAQGLGRKKPMITISKLTPTQFKKAVADKNIERRFASRFYSNEVFSEQLDRVRREITGKNPVPMFKETVSSYEQWKNLCKQHKIQIPAGPAWQPDLQNMYLRYLLKQALLK